MTIIVSYEASRYASQIEKALWLADYLNDQESHGKEIRVTREIADSLHYIQGANITIPDGVQFIEWGAFKGMNIESVVIPDSVTRIGHEAFENTNLKSVVIPSSVENVGKGAFASTNLENVILEGSPVLNEHSFQRTPLTFIVGRYSDVGYGSRNPGIVFVEDGVLKREHIEEYFEIRNSSLSHVVDSQFKNPNAPGLSFDIPEGVEHIGANAFDGMSVEKIVLPDSLKTIGDSAFAGTQISEVVIPNGVYGIGEGAFAGTPLVNVDIGEGVRSIGDDAFADTQITNIQLPISLITIGEGAFAGTRFENGDFSQTKPDTEPEAEVKVEPETEPETEADIEPEPEGVELETDIEVEAEPVLPDPVTEFDDPQIISEPVLPDPVFKFVDPLTGSEPIQFEGVLEPFDSLTNPNQVFAGTVSETIELTALDLQGGVEETFIERDPFALSGGEEIWVIEPIDGLQGLLTDGPAEFSEEQLQTDLVNSMAAPSEVLA